MNMKSRAVMLFILISIGPNLIAATRDGRLIGKVLDPAGKPIEGVTVVASSDEVAGFREVETTDRRGVFKFDFPERFVTYTIRFEKGGYFPIESRQEWKLEGTARQEFTMTPGDATVDAGGIVSTSSLAISKFNIGVQAFNARDLSTAEKRFSEALEADPQLHQALVALSRVYMEQGRYKEAVEAAEKAIELGSTDETVWRTRWEGYRELGNEEMTVEALKDLEDATVRAEEARGIYNQAVALTRGGDHEGAFVKFQEALEVDPNLEEAQAGLAVSALEIGRHEEAASAAETVLRNNPQDERALRIRYNAALELEDDERLVEALIGLRDIEPVVARDGLLRLAFEVYDENDMPKARERFVKVLEVDPDHALTHYFLGLINANLGETDEARAHLERFVALAPDHSEAPSARELIDYLKSGN